MVPIFLSTLIGCCLFIVYGGLIDYYRRAWTAIPLFADAGRTGQTDQTDQTGETGETGHARTSHTRISVLIPARNEGANIARCIESLSRQSYPKDLYQVIVIDDHSTDSTGEIVANLYPPEMSLVYARLADITPPAQLAYKKLAIETGIGMSSGDLIATTDADCTFDPDWLTTLAAFYEEKGAKFIAAPVRIGSPAPAFGSRAPAFGSPASAFASPAPARPAHTFLSIFQTLDFITLQGITGAAVFKKFHSMCNGANLAYEKAAFYEVGGFKGIATIPSGDDMLLMHKIYSRYPDKVFFLKSTKAIVTTRPETTWKGFIHQRVRWASKADRYDDKRIFWVLLLVYVVNVLFAILPIAACWNSWWLWLLIIGLLTKTMLEFPFVFTVAGFFGQQSLLRWFPLMQPFHIIYTVAIGWMGKFGSYRWKGRKISK
jgi:cellulose synthase/poly-beta-1,6-N-acetylglucosamine synthase-like glycosyltransferase